MVRAKFKCTSCEPSGEGFQIYMSPVTYGSPENDEFYKWTPSGQLSLGVVSPLVAKHFVPGQEYYLDISHAN